MMAKLALLLFCGTLYGAEGANASAPHPHKGLIPRLKFDGKPDIKLSASDLQAIEDGKLWMQSKEEKGIGRGLGVRDIAAPADVVFGQIADLEGYVGKVPMLNSLKVYESKKKGQDVMEKGKYVVKVVPGYNFEYFVEHHSNKAKGVVLFYLDYDRYSDFNDMQGKWFLEEHPTKSGWTRVYYQCDLQLYGYAPKIVKTLLTSKGLSSAISWVKRESEKRAPKPVAASAFVALSPSASASQGLSTALAQRPSAMPAGRQDGSSSISSLLVEAAPLGVGLAAAAALALALRFSAREKAKLRAVASRCAVVHLQ